MSKEIVLRIPPATEIARLINIAADAVEKSQFGPVMMRDPKDLSKLQFNQVSNAIFAVVLNALLQNKGVKGEDIQISQGQDKTV